MRIAIKKLFTLEILVCFLMGSLFLFFSGGRWNIAIASWLAPVFLIRLSRLSKPLTGFLVIFIMSSFISSIIWQGVIPFDGIPFYIIHIVGGVFSALAYLIERIFWSHNRSFKSTLIFPLVSVVFGYLHISTSLYGANGSLAITQDNLALLQTLSISGMWGIIFLVTWFGPFVNWIWENQFKVKQISKGVIIYISVLFIVFMYGNLRLTFFTPKSELIRIASISSQLSDPDISDWDLFKKQSMQKQLRLLTLSEKAACSGAQVVIWREGEIYLLREDEDTFIKNGCNLAKALNIYLGMSMATFTKDFPSQLAQNKIVWIDTTGNVLFEYLKALPTPTEKCVAGDGKVKILNYPHSKMASTICFDLDFPSFIRKFGESGIDIMLSPANDWYEISNVHPQQVSFRAIENGFSLVRPNSNAGLAAAYDPYGRIISSLNYAYTENEIMISDVSQVGVKTIYRIIGDAFAWFCLFALTLFILSIFYKRYKSV